MIMISLIMTIIFGICFIPTSFIMVKIYNIDWKYLLCIFIYGFFCGEALLLISVFIINILIRPFSNSICISNNQIIYEHKQLNLDLVTNLTVYVPIIERYSSKPFELVVWIDYNNYLSIKRPSIRLIKDLKKRCSNSKFRVEGLNDEIKESIHIGLIVSLVIVIVEVVKYFINYQY